MTVTLNTVPDESRPASVQKLAAVAAFVCLPLCSAQAVAATIEPATGGPLLLAGASVWDEYSRIRRGESASEQAEEPAPQPRKAPPAEVAPATTPATAAPPVESTVPAAQESPWSRRPTAKPVRAPEKPTETGSWWAFYEGTLDIARRPFYGPYGLDFKWAYARKNPLPPNPRIVVHMHGSGGGVGSMGVFGPSSLGDIEVRTQDAETYRQEWVEWWTYGPNGGPYPGRRIASILQFIKKRYGVHARDRGIVLQGPSMGGAGAVIQTMILPDPWRERIAWSSARVGVIMPRQIARRNPGQYPNMPPDSGAGKAVWDSIDFAIQSAIDPVVQGIHYRHSFSSDDQFSKGPRGSTQLEFVNLVEKHRIGGAFTWVKGDHSSHEPGLKMPDVTTFEAPEQDVTLDRAHPAITQSTGNYPRRAKDRVDENKFPRGHYNLGITWDHAKILDEPSQVVFPLRYRARSNFGKGVPNQPRRITVNVTPRRPRNFTLTEGETLHWSWGEDSLTGTAIVRDRVVTVKHLPLVSGEPYKRLRIYRRE